MKSTLRGRIRASRICCFSLCCAIGLSWPAMTANVTAVDDAGALEVSRGVALVLPPSGADDTEALQQAINSLPAYERGLGGGTIQLLPAVYTLSRTIRLKSGVEIVGAGRRRTILTGAVDGAFFDTASDGTIMERTLWFGMRDLFLRNLSQAKTARCLLFTQAAQFVGERLCMFSTGGYHAEIVGGNLLTFRSVQFGGGNGAEASVYINGTTPAGHVNVVRFDACDFQDAKSGLRAVGGTALVVHGCHFENLKGGLSEADASLYVAEWSAGEITGNYFDTCEQIQLAFGQLETKSTGFVIGGNYHFNTSAAGFVSLDGLAQSAILGNHFNPGELNRDANGLYAGTSGSENAIAPQSLASGTGHAVVSGPLGTKTPQRDYWPGRGEAPGWFSSLMKSVASLGAEVERAGIKVLRSDRKPSLALIDGVIDWSLADSFTQTVRADTAMTFKNPRDGQSITVAIIRIGKDWAVTWPGTIRWNQESASPQPNLGMWTDVYRFVNIQGTIYGEVGRNYRPPTN